MSSGAAWFVLALLAFGYAAGRSGWFPASAAETLNRFALALCLPAAILRQVPQLTLDTDLLWVAAVPWALLLFSALAVIAWCRLFAWSDAVRAALLLCVPLGNTSFLGYPMTEALLGESALPYAVIYDQFGSFVALSTWGLWVLARYGGDAPPTTTQMAWRMLRFPPFIALIVALTLMPAEPPAPVAEALRRLSDALLPVAVFGVGLTLKLRLPRDDTAPLALGLTLKLLALPALVFGLRAALLPAGIAADATLIEAAMPPMMTAGALAVSHRLAPTLAAALIGYGTVLSLLTLPLWAMLIH